MKFVRLRSAPETASFPGAQALCTEVDCRCFLPDTPSLDLDLNYQPRKQSSTDHFHYLGLLAVASPAFAMTNYSKWDKFAADLASDTEEEEERELGDYTAKTVCYIHVPPGDFTKKVGVEAGNLHCFEPTKQSRSSRRVMP
eukprot:s981_g9.t1